MRIVKISVKKLFGVYDHEIPLNQESRITILHGPNGVGKTAIMRLTYGLLRRDYQVFVQLPFQEFAIVTANEDGSQEVRVVKKHRERNDEDGSDDDTGASYPIEISYADGSGKSLEDPFTPKRYREDDPRERRQVSRELRRLHGLEFVGSSRWLDPRSGDIMTLQEATEIYDVHSLLGKRDEPKWLEDIRNSLDTRLIRAERLTVLRPQGIQYRETGRYRPSDTFRVHTVEELSHDIVKRIDDTTERFAKISNELDSAFPRRVIEDGHISIDQEMRDELEKLDDYRTKLDVLGLLDEYGEAASLDASKPSATEPADSTEALQRIFLSTYLANSRAKLDTFDTIFKQLSMLTTTINKRFENKQLSIHRRKGFVVTGHDNQTIPLTSLSSGEQHELVLLYQLLVQTSRDSLIMIDEPEISLHVNWQEQFLNDIQRISEFRQFDVLIATHSPDIIGDKHEWMIGLGKGESAQLWT